MFVVMRTNCTLGHTNSDDGVLVFIWWTTCHAPASVISGKIAVRTFGHALS